MANKGECDANYSASRQEKTKQALQMRKTKYIYTTACKYAHNKLLADKSNITKVCVGTKTLWKGI